MRKKKKRNKSRNIILILGIIIFGIIAGMYFSKPIVCIDAGHGGNDVGSILETEKRYEKDDTLKIAQKVKECLEKQNINVILTRSDDTYVSLEKRCRKANFFRADLFVSIHRNSSTTGNGVEVWFGSESDENSEKLANDIMNKLAKTNIQTNRGVKKGTSESQEKDYYVNKYTNMPSCLIELGFISNKTDNKLFDENIDEYAKAIADGIIENLNLEDKN